MKNFSPTLSWLASIGLISLLVACGSSNQPSITQPSVIASQNTAIKPGGIYVYKGGEGSFGTLKVLVAEEGMVDVVLYKNRFATVPSSIDPKSLEVAVKHEVLSVKGFQNWQPQLLLEQPVTKEELVDRP
jgi:hypothetical protein